MPGMRPPILTLTVNPALDIACTAASVRPTHKMRTADERYDAGGGGVNVARVLHGLGCPTRALMLTGDVTGRLVEELLDQQSVPWQSVPIQGRTRISYTVHDRADGNEFRFVPEGPQILPAEITALLDILRSTDAEWIVASGSLPPGVPVDFYAQEAAIAAARGQKFVLDTSGEALRAAAAGQGVALLKLSQDELAALTGQDVTTPAAQERCIHDLLARRAAQIIVVSLGADGAVMGSAGGIDRMPALKVEVRSAVGAGDSFLAGMVFALSRGLSPRQALAMATAAGAAAVSNYGTALVHRADMAAFYQQLGENPMDLDTDRNV